MKISVLGLGYVGCVTAACLATEGHEIIGVDVNRQKVDEINSGKPTVIEKDLDPFVKQAVKSGKLKATTDAGEAVINSELSLICVGTPSNSNGSLDLTHVKKVCEDIGRVLATKKDFHVVVIRSTVLPGSTEDVLIPVLEKSSQKRVFEDFGVCVNPEFMREGSGIYDFYNPERIVIGTLDQKSGDLVEKMYTNLDAPTIRTDIKTAEMIKYVDNSFHGLKVCFANEIGNICKKLGIDSHEVMNIFCMDKKLNLSPYYLRPGLAFGGSCIPKDLRALVYKSKRLDLDSSVLESILDSNQKHKEKCVNLILEQKKKKIGIFGLSFKAGTDDIRESPTVDIIETLLGKGYDVHVYDCDLSIQDIFGANRAYIEKKIPHITSLLCSSIREVVDRSDVLVLSNQSEEFKEIPKMMRDDHILIDFVRLIEPNDVKKGRYVGICW